MGRYRSLTLATNRLDAIRHHRSASGFLGSHVEKSVLAFLHPRIQLSELAFISRVLTELAIGRMGRVPTAANPSRREPDVKIAVLGAGNVGTAVARAAVETGNEVTLTATNAAKARDVAGQVG